MTALEILRRARERILVPAKWTQRAYALNAAGMSVYGHSPDAVRWCAVGAIRAEAPAWHPQSSAAMGALNGAAFRTEGMGVMSLNDLGTHAQVIAVFDAAIRSLEEPK